MVIFNCKLLNYQRVYKKIRLPSEKNITKHHVGSELKRHFLGWSSTAGLGTFGTRRSWTSWIWISCVPSWNVQCFRIIVRFCWVPDKDSEVMSCPKHFEWRDTAESLKDLWYADVSLGILPSRHQPKPQPLPVTKPNPCPHAEKSAWCFDGKSPVQNEWNLSKSIHQIYQIQTSSYPGMSVETAMSWATCNIDQFHRLTPLTWTNSNKLSKQ